MTRSEAEPNTSSPTVFQAPEGTFEYLTAIEGAKLGNAYTKRLVMVMKMPNVFPVVHANPNLRDDMAVVNLRIRALNKENVEDNYFLGIDPGNKIVVLDSWRHTLYPRQQTPLETPDVQTLLNEIKTAQKIQLTLKR